MAVLAFWVEQLTFGDAIVGAGTLALAAVTAYLGVETRATAKAAREAVESAEEPFVIATPTPDVEHMTLRDHELKSIQERQGPPPFQIHRSREDEDGRWPFVRMRLWNTGMGPAIVNGVELCGGGELLAASAEQYPLTISGIADIEVSAPSWQEEGTILDSVLLIKYSHADGRDYTTVSAIRIVGNIVRCTSYERERPKPRHHGIFRRP